MPNEHPCFKTKNEEDCPIWPRLRTIDGYHYTLDSQHQTLAQAQDRVAEIRKSGDGAQAFESGLPKWQAQKDGAYTPAFAAVYTVPKGHRVELTEEEYKVVARKAPSKPKKKGATAKATAKPKAKPKPKAKKD